MCVAFAEQLIEGGRGGAAPPVAVSTNRLCSRMHAYGAYLHTTNRLTQFRHTSLVVAAAGTATLTRPPSMSRCPDRLGTRANAPYGTPRPKRQ
jgi:hypothetical protein